MPSKRKTCSYPLAKTARVIDDRLHVTLRDGRQLIVPLDQFPKLKLAPAAARSKVKVKWGHTGIDWPDLRFELGVGGLVHQCSTTKGCTITAKPKRR